MSFFPATSSNTASTTTGDLKSDVEVGSPPSDTISDICFSPQADFLAASSWDSKVRIYEIGANGQSQGKAIFEHDGPVLGIHWAKDGTKLASASADQTGKIFDIASGVASQFAFHDKPIKCVRFLDASNSPSLIATGSWDKTLKFWDLRQQKCVAGIELQERVYAMDVQQQLLVLGLAERYINIVNLSNPGVIYKTSQSPLKWQTRTIACFPNATGYAVGSTEGRCAIQYVDDKDSNLNFSFKCHRDTGTSPGSRDSVKVYAVNTIAFHPIFGTFSTAGADGTFHFWDKDAKHRLKGYPNVGGQISASCFNANGTIFAYAVGYDWSQGFHGNSATSQVRLMLHPIREDEAKPRSISKKR